MRQYCSILRSVAHVCTETAPSSCDGRPLARVVCPPVAKPGDMHAGLRFGTLFALPEGVHAAEINLTPGVAL